MWKSFGCIHISAVVRCIGNIHTVTGVVRYLPSARNTGELIQVSTGSTMPHFYALCLLIQSHLEFSYVPSFVLRLDVRLTPSSAEVASIDCVRIVYKA